MSTSEECYLHTHSHLSLWEDHNSVSTATVYGLMNNTAEIKIKLCHDLEKFIKKKTQTNFVYDPYLKTKKLGYYFIALNTQKCGEFEV